MKSLQAAESLALVVVAALLVFIALGLRGANESSSVGAIGSPASLPTPTSIASPVTSQAPSPTGMTLGCGVFVEQVTRYNLDVAGYSAASDAVVTGTVAAVSEGRWATKDGSPPVNEPGMLPDTAQVYRVVEVALTAVGKQPKDRDALTVGETITVRVLGGTIGCRTFRYSDDFDFKTGSQIALFLAIDLHRSLELAPAEDFDALDVWPIIDGVVTGRGVPMSTELFLSIATGTD